MILELLPFSLRGKLMKSRLRVGRVSGVRKASKRRKRRKRFQVTSWLNWEVASSHLNKTSSLMRKMKRMLKRQSLDIVMSSSIGVPLLSRMPRKEIKTTN